MLVNGSTFEITYDVHIELKSEQAKQRCHSYVKYPRVTCHINVSDIGRVMEDTIVKQPLLQDWCLHTGVQNMQRAEQESVQQEQTKMTNNMTILTEKSNRP